MLKEPMVKDWEVKVRGKSERTFDDLHMSGYQGREGRGRDEGIKEGTHIGIEVY